MSYKSFRLLFMFLIAVLGLFFARSVAAEGCCNVGDVCTTMSDSDMTTLCTIPISPNIPCTAFDANIKQLECNKGCCCITPVGQAMYPSQDVLSTTCQAVQAMNADSAFYPGVIGAACNIDFCNGALPQVFTVSGFIFDANKNAIQGATVRTSNNSIVKSSSAGAYSFNDIIRASTITITANQSDCQGSVTVSNVNSNKKGINITVDCCQTVQYNWGPCNTVTKVRQRIVSRVCGGQVKSQWVENETCQIEQPCQWNCTWTGCPSADGYRYSTCNEIPAGCTLHIAAPPLKERCIDENPSCNHDGFVDGIEECDLNATSGIFNSNCEKPYNTTSWCDAGTCQCIIPPIIKTGCEADPGNLTNLHLSQVPKQRAFLLDWLTSIDECRMYVDHFELRRCINASGVCNFNTNIDLHIDKTLRQYIDNKTNPKIVANKTYCYELTEVFNNSIINPALKKSKIVECIDSGDLECMQPHPDSWCGKNPQTKRSNSRLSCDENNNLVGDNCPKEKYCTLGPDGAMCVEQGPCDLCNNVFAVFGNQLFYDASAWPSYKSNKVLAKQNIDGDIYQLCPTLLNPIPQVTDTYHELGGCFLDFSRSTFDAAYFCNETNTCYDYSSPGACRNDYCNKFTLNSVNNCEWAPYSIDFNTGVCRPKDPEYRMIQNCTLCTTEANRIYPSCTNDVCPLYGYCYFDSVTEKCASGMTIGCKNYRNQDDCIGSITHRSSVFVDAGLTNKLLSSSYDALAIGRCKLLVLPSGSQQCIKDADNNNIDDCKDTKLPTAMMQICEHDTTPPVTTVFNRSVYALMIDLSDMYITDDGPWLIGDDTHKGILNYTKMKYCVSPIGFSCYPSITLNTSVTSNNRYSANLSEFQNQLGQRIDASNSNGQGFTFYYFSQDPAKNLEEVKKFNFILDAKPPVLTVTKIFNTFPQGPTWKTNLTFSIRLDQEDYRPVDCRLTLRPARASLMDFSGLDNYDIGPDSPPYNYQIFSIGGTLNTTYPYLPESYYDYNLTCTDVAGNIYHENATFKVEGDLRINNATPALNTYRSAAGLGALSAPATMTLHTTGPGTCRYSDTTYAYQNMTKIFSSQKISNNDYLHTAKLDIRATNPSGIYRYYTACNIMINGVLQIVTGDDVDNIYFAIDDLPPQTQLMYASDTDTLDPYNSSQSAESLNLKLWCNDSAYQLIESYNMGTGDPFFNDMSFRCDPASTRYCIRRADSPGMCTNVNDLAQFRAYDGSAISFDYTNDTASLDKVLYGNSPYVCYYSADKGLNIEYGSAYGTPVCTRLNVRNGLFLPPEINVSAGD